MRRWLLFAFALLWAGAAFLFLVGTYGWFGQERDPLSGVFLLPLGMPWILAIGAAPEAARPWLALAAPGLTLAILARFFGRRS